MEIPFFQPDVQALQKTGLVSWHTFAAWTAGIAFLVLAGAFIAMNLLNDRAVKEAERLRLVELQGEGLTNILWLASAKQLVGELGYASPVQMKDLSIFLHPTDAISPPQDEPAYPVVSVVIQRNKKTVAIADLLRVHDVATWELGSADRLRLNDKVISLDEAFESQGFWKACEPLQAPGLAIIFVGLESYPKSDRGGDGEDLSTRRARVLGEKCLDRTRGYMPYKPDTMFLGVGLGRATTSTQVGDPLEARQRAAVIVTLSRRMARDEALPIADAFAAVINSTSVKGTDLRLYTFSEQAADRLRNSALDYKGFLPTGALQRPPGATLQ